MVCAENGIAKVGRLPSLLDVSKGKGFPWYASHLSKPLQK